MRDAFVANQAKFPLGQTVITPTALEQLTDADVLRALTRHVAGDWGDVVPEDREANEQALTASARLLSVYRSTSGVKFWVITEWDRSATTVLLPEDC